MAGITCLELGASQEALLKGEEKMLDFDNSANLVNILQKFRWTNHQNLAHAVVFLLLTKDWFSFLSLV